MKKTEKRFKIKGTESFSQRTVQEKVFNIFNITVMCLLMLAFLLPYWMIFVSSFTDNSVLERSGYLLFPQKFSIDAYSYLLMGDSNIVRSILNSLYLTFMTTVLSLLVSALFAYPLAIRHFKGRKFFAMFLLITMLFGGGLIPFYLTVNALGLNDSHWALILPSLMSAWNVILIRNYFYTIPYSIFESAQIDGASHTKVLFRFYIPLSMPILATVILFVAVGMWNNWFGPLLFLQTKEKFPVQYVIREMLASMTSSTGPGQGGSTYVPTISSRSAAVIIASLPIICTYPFLQKYFINGVIIGSVKE